jgi:hypothetical protein
MPPFAFAQGEPYGEGTETRRLTTIWLLRGLFVRGSPLFYPYNTEGEQRHTPLTRQGTLSGHQLGPVPGGQPDDVQASTAVVFYPVSTVTPAPSQHQDISRGVSQAFL